MKEPHAAFAFTENMHTYEPKSCVFTGLSCDSPDSRVVCRHDHTAEFTSNPDSLMHQGSHFVKAKACHDSSSILVLVGDTERGPVEHLVGASTGSREPVEWSRYLRDSEKCSLTPDVEFQKTVWLSSVLKQISDIQDVSDSKEFDSEQSVAYSQSGSVPFVVLKFQHALEML